MASQVPGGAAPYSLSLTGGPDPLGATVLTKFPIVRQQLWDRTPMAPEMVVSCDAHIPTLYFAPAALHTLRQQLLAQQLSQSMQQRSKAAHTSATATGAGDAKTSELPSVAARLHARYSVDDTAGGAVAPQLSLIVDKCLSPGSVGTAVATAYSQSRSGNGSDVLIDVYAYERRKPSPPPSLNTSKEQQIAAIRASWNSGAALPAAASGAATGPAAAAAAKAAAAALSRGLLGAGAGAGVRSSVSGVLVDSDSDADGVGGVSLVDASSCVPNTAQYVAAMLHQKLTRAEQRDGPAGINQFVTVRAVCAPHAPTTSLALRGEILVPSYALRFTVVNTVPLEDSPLARQLEMHAYPTSGMASGFLTADQYRQAVPLEATNPYAYQKPLMGIWFYGVDRVDHPFVWSHCLRYIFCASIRERIGQAQHSFLVLFFKPNERLHAFMECSFDPMGSQFRHFEFSQDISLPDAHTAHPAGSVAKRSALGAASSSASLIRVSCRAVTDRALSRKFRHAEKLVHEIEHNRIATSALHAPIITSPEKEDDAHAHAHAHAHSHALSTPTGQRTPITAAARSAASDEKYRVPSAPLTFTPNKAYPQQTGSCGSDDLENVDPALRRSATLRGSKQQPLYAPHDTAAAVHQHSVRRSVTATADPNAEFPSPPRTQAPPNPHPAPRPPLHGPVASPAFNRLFPAPGANALYAPLPPGATHTTSPPPLPQPTSGNVLGAATAALPLSFADPASSALPLPVATAQSHAYSSHIPHALLLQALQLLSSPHAQALAPAGLPPALQQFWQTQGMAGPGLAPWMGALSGGMGMGGGVGVGDSGVADRQAAQQLQNLLGALFMWRLDQVAQLQTANGLARALLPHTPLAAGAPAAATAPTPAAAVATGSTAPAPVPAPAPASVPTTAVPASASASSAASDAVTGGDDLRASRGRIRTRPSQPIDTSAAGTAAAATTTAAAATTASAARTKSPASPAFTPSPALSAASSGRNSPGFLTPRSLSPAPDALAEAAAPRDAAVAGNTTNTAAGGAFGSPRNRKAAADSGAAAPTSRGHTSSDDDPTPPSEGEEPRPRAPRRTSKPAASAVGPPPPATSVTPHKVRVVKTDAIVSSVRPAAASALAAAERDRSPPLSPDNTFSSLSDDDQRLGLDTDSGADAAQLSPVQPEYGSAADTKHSAVASAVASASAPSRSVDTDFGSVRGSATMQSLELLRSSTGSTFDLKSAIRSAVSKTSGSGSGASTAGGHGNGHSGSGSEADGGAGSGLDVDSSSFEVNAEEEWAGLPPSCRQYFVHNLSVASAAAAAPPGPTTGAGRSRAALPVAAVSRDEFDSLQSTPHKGRAGSGARGAGALTSVASSLGTLSVGSSQHTLPSVTSSLRYQPTARERAGDTAMSSLAASFDPSASTSSLQYSALSALARAMGTATAAADLDSPLSSPDRSAAAAASAARKAGSRLPASANPAKKR